MSKKYGIRVFYKDSTNEYPDYYDAIEMVDCSDKDFFLITTENEFIHIAKDRVFKLVERPVVHDEKESM